MGTLSKQILSSIPDPPSEEGCLQFKQYCVRKREQKPNRLRTGSKGSCKNHMHTDIDGGMHTHMLFKAVFPLVHKACACSIFLLCVLSHSFLFLALKLIKDRIFHGQKQIMKHMGRLRTHQLLFS